ncbi:hypothetical protein [Thalassolituus sp. C2-1]|jgi:hypothetical protein|uniref:hypothetical protein n=1 Tax=Venatorbacter sp. C2-1 TaxID=2597518 RepID=UPI001190D182|nr:hypothetical protein [Thalassolituus sp. C2-1]TVV44033.1 hypothetical protein FOT50_10350 [Thalassolituus sp. C2-1]
MPIDIEMQKERFDSFRKERMPVLHDFSEKLGFKNAHEILINPAAFLEPISSWLSEQDISEDAKNWIIVRIGYFIGELFIEKHGGCWSVCEAPSSRFYGHYVIGGFSSFNNLNALLAPMEAAFELANQPKGRSLSAIVNEIEVGLSGL